MRWRRVAVIAGIVIGIGAAGAATSGLFIYNEATKIDRTEPQVVTDEYLRAALVRKDFVGADLYACKNQERLAPIKTLRAELDQREKEFDITVLVSWGAFRQEGKTLTTELTISGRKGITVTSKRSETWRFTMADEDGWRVCGAEKIATPSPTPSASATPTTAP